MGPWSALLAAALVLVSCGGPDPDSAETSPSAPAEDVHADVATAGVGSLEHVQDLWLFQQVAVVGAAEAETLDEEIFAWLGSEATETVELPGGASFHRVGALDAQVLAPDDSPRDDVDVIAGYVEFEEAHALAMLGTVHDGAEHIGYQDHLDLDLTAVEGIRAGDIISYELAFLQTLPMANHEDEAGLSGLEMLSQRLEAERYLYAGYRDEQGDIRPGTFSQQLAAVVEGSDRPRLPAKSQDMIEGMGDAVSDCSVWECIVDWFENLGPGGGGGSSWDNALCNGNIGTDCAPPPPPAPYCSAPPCSSTHGDPYLSSYHGGTVQFHLVGEFVLTSGDDLEVQVRMEPAYLDGLAFNTGVAIESDARRLTLVYEDEEIVSRIDGESVAGADLHAALEAAGWHASVLDDTYLQVTTDRGHTVSVSLRHRSDHQYLDVYIDLAEEVPGFVGLLGGAHADEPGWMSRDGEEFSLRALGDRTTRYRDFGDTWRITDDESLFDYAEGESTATYTDLSFPASGSIEADDLDPEDPEIAQAEAVCRTAGIETQPHLSHCVLDLWATGDISVVLSARTADRVRHVNEGEADGEEFSPWSAWDHEEPPAGTIDASWNTSVREIRERYGFEEGDRFEVTCAPEAESDGRTNTRIWGTDVYWTTSPVCAAAVHAGQATLDEGGTFEVELLDDVRHQEIEPEPRHGIDPRQWVRTGSGFQFTESADS
ncbi:LCCL domain-containing protein [Nesterenkonia suensis]